MNQIKNNPALLYKAILAPYKMEVKCLHPGSLAKQKCLILWDREFNALDVYNQCSTNMSES